MNELVRRQSVEEIVGHRDCAIAQYKVAIDALELCKRAVERFNGYGYLGEFEPNRNDLDEFRKHVDRAAWRKLVRLTLIDQLMDFQARQAFERQIEDDPPEVTVVPRGTFHRWLGDAGKLGGQHKVPRVTNDRTLAEALLARARLALS